MKILITGGCGFIGSNLSKYFMDHGAEVVVFDNLSRNGTESNLDWLKSQAGSFTFIKGDVRSPRDLEYALKNVDLVFHLAAQVAVTTSVIDPAHDFEVNLAGTVNVLEAIRKRPVSPMIIFTSTNKVYGKMDHIAIIERNGRWEYEDFAEGNPETTPLDFYSPYGCSKGGADQYVHDYSRIYGIPSVVFRMSCIYGPRQMGCEDQGWVAFFLIQAVLGKSITIYGDGKQIRDVLYIDDLVNAFVSAYRNRAGTAGNVYNIGGGPHQTLSLLELINFIESTLKMPLPYTFSDWRPGDQKVYVSDIRKAKNDFNWHPAVDPETGLTRLCSWISENRSLFEN